jgi:hypothetical protein
VISACDELIRQGNAAVQSCATREGVASWSEKKLQALATKLQDKITSSGVIFTLTSENTVISDNGERTSLHLLGKEKLETMMSLASTVAMVWELAKALSLASDACGEHNTGATSLEASAAFVYACAAGLVQAGVTVAPTVYQQICKRQAFEYLERMELGRVASLLDVGCLDVGDPSEPFNVSVLLKPRMDAQQFGAFYGSLVCDVFVEVARAYDQEALAKFTYEMADSKVKHDADLAKDIFVLHSLLNPESATLDHLTDALARPTSPTFMLAKACGRGVCDGGSQGLGQEARGQGCRARDELVAPRDDSACQDPASERHYGEHHGRREHSSQAPHAPRGFAKHDVCKVRIRQRGRAERHGLLDRYVWEDSVIGADAVLLDNDGGATRIHQSCDGREP